METAHVVREVAGMMREGMSRDDAYHAIVRYAAERKLNRYNLWLEVQRYMGES